MAKIAVAIEPPSTRPDSNRSAGHPTARILARGEDWTVADVVCTCGPDDRPFEEQHSQFAIAVVADGTFQYRSPLGRVVMTPGALMLGNAGQCFECGHEHGTGDRCLSFWYAPDYFEQIAADSGLSGGSPRFRAARLPPLRALTALVTRACAGLARPSDVPWDELGVDVAVAAVRLSGGITPEERDIAPSAIARVTRAIQCIAGNLGGNLTLARLAREARLSPYHFLRTFERLTGVTPHQYVQRARLREAAIRVAEDSGRVLDIALECGFGDVSNFNRAFRTEFGMSPRAYRRGARP